MEILKEPITRVRLAEIAQKRFGNMVKAVVDVEKSLMAIDADLHADEEALLIEQGSDQKNLWGINLYPGLEGPDFIEFDSMINVRPSQDNRTRSVENEETRKKIIQVVEKLISHEHSA